MSDKFSGITFAEQLVTPSDDAILHRAIVPDGILTGCAITYSGAVLTMGIGTLMLCGRMIRHAAAQSWSVADAGSGYARLVLTVDLSRTATKDTFDQVIDSIEYAASLDGFAPLVQSDINENGVIYQLAVCVVSLGSGGITGIVESAEPLDSGSLYAPAGFGLGTTRGTVERIVDLDRLVHTGWWNLSVPSADAVLFGVNFSRSTVSVNAYSADDATQTVTPLGTQIHLTRTRTGGQWGSWCIENPPMVPGVEYRSVELCAGNPVFVKRLAYTASNFTAELVKLPHEVEGLNMCLSAEAIWKRTDVDGDGWHFLPESDPSTGSADGHVEWVNGEHVVFRLGSTVRLRMSRSSEPVYVTLRYTKH